MKKIGLLLLSCIFTFGVFAQKKETKKIKIGDKKYIIVTEDDGLAIKDLDNMNFEFDFDTDDIFKFTKK